MATIRDKMGHSCPNVCPDTALRETTPPISEGTEEADTHPAHSTSRRAEFAIRRQPRTRFAFRENSAREPKATEHCGNTGLWLIPGIYGTSLFEALRSRFYVEGEPASRSDGRNREDNGPLCRESLPYPTIIRAGTYTKAQPLIGSGLTSPHPDRLFAPDTRPTIPVRRIVIAGISCSLSGDFVRKQAGSRTRDSSLSQERGDPAPSLPGAPRGLSVRSCSNDCGTPGSERVE